MVFKGKRNAMSNCMISSMTAQKLMRKRCMAYLAYVIDTKKNETKLSQLSIVREFPNVFSNGLLGLPL